MDYSSNEENAGALAVQTFVFAEKDAKVKLYQVGLQSDSDISLNDIGAKGFEKRRIHLSLYSSYLVERKYLQVQEQALQAREVSLYQILATMVRPRSR